MQGEFRALSSKIDPVRSSDLRTVGILKGYYPVPQGEDRQHDLVILKLPKGAMGHGGALIPTAPAIHPQPEQRPHREKHPPNPPKRNHRSHPRTKACLPQSLRRRGSTFLRKKITKLQKNMIVSSLHYYHL